MSTTKRFFEVGFSPIKLRRGPVASARAEVNPCGCGMASVGVPDAYNEEAFIGTLLNRVLSVDTESLGFTKEIIVVDDGSKDGTSAMVRHFPSVSSDNARTLRIAKSA